MYTPFTAKHALSNTLLIDLLFLFIAELSAYKYLNKKISLMSFGFFFGQRPKPIFQPHKKKSIVSIFRGDFLGPLEWV